MGGSYALNLRAVCTKLSVFTFSLEILTVDGHMKKGKYIPSHLHFNVTYLVEAEENQALVVCEGENKGVKWFTFEDALKASSEPWMVERIYRKLISKENQG